MIEIRVAVPLRLALLLVVVEIIMALTAARIVDQDARLRATPTYGNLVARAIDGYVHDRGRPPASLGDLVPRYLDAIPLPVYGANQWAYDPSETSVAGGDYKQRLELGTPVHRAEWSLAVLVDGPRQPGRFERVRDGCWRLPELPTCW